MYISQVQILTGLPRTDSHSTSEIAITNVALIWQLAIVGSDKACVSLKEVDTPKRGSEETAVKVPGRILRQTGVYLLHFRHVHRANKSHK